MLSWSVNVLFYDTWLSIGLSINSYPEPPECSPYMWLYLLIQFNIILPYLLAFPSSSEVPDQHSAFIYLFYDVCYMFCPFNPPLSLRRYDNWRILQITKFLITEAALVYHYWIISSFLIQRLETLSEWAVRFHTHILQLCHMPITHCCTQEDSIYIPFVLAYFLHYKPLTLLLSEYTGAVWM
jgi:hypothetical protein